MTEYKLDYELNDGEYVTITTSDIDYLIGEFEEIKMDENCVCAAITELYIYGGICQGEKILHEYKKED